MNQDDIRNIFNKLDVNGDGSITKEEFLQSAQEINIMSSPDEVDAFMNMVDTDKDGKVSFEEFNHFVQFNQSHLKDFKFILQATSRSIGYAKKLDKIMDIKNLNEDHSSKAKILFRDQEATNIDELQSSLQLHIGDLDTNEHIAKILNKKLDINVGLGLKFHVKDKELIKKNFEEYIQALKDFLGELGPEAADIIKELNIQLLDVEDGVILLIDPAGHPFVSSYIDILKQNFEQIHNLKSAFSLMVGTGGDVGNKSATFEQLINSNFYFELSGRAIRLSNLAHTDSIKNSLKALNANKESKIALLGALCLLSFKSVNLEILLNSNDRKEFIQQAEIQNLNEPAWENHFNKANDQIAESGVGDFLDSLDFIKQAINDLKTAECTSVTGFAKIHDVYALVNVKVDAYTALDELFGLQG